MCWDLWLVLITHTGCIVEREICRSLGQYVLGPLVSTHTGLRKEKRKTRTMEL